MSCMCCPFMEATWDFLRGQCYSQNLLPGWISLWYSMPMPSASGRRQSLTAQTQSRLCLARSNLPKDSGSLQYISPFGSILFPHLLLQVSILLDILWLGLITMIFSKMELKQRLTSDQSLFGYPVTWICNLLLCLKNWVLLTVARYRATELKTACFNIAEVSRVKISLPAGQALDLQHLFRCR